MKILDQQQGLFGVVTVADQDAVRQLLIGHQIQGSANLEPAFEGITPGPVAQSGYMSGWLLAGTQNSTGSGLMLGLGSGAGAIAMLHNFPGIDLTVVEVDPVVVQLATKWFPLLGRYLDEGRLQIVQQDAEQYVRARATETDDRWSFGLCDAYQGGNETYLPDSILTGMLATCDELWFNCIDRPDGPQVQHMYGSLQALGKPIRHAFDPRRGEWQKLPRNMILTTQTVDPMSVDSFYPYPELEGPTVDAARMDYTRWLCGEIVSNAVDS